MARALRAWRVTKRRHDPLDATGARVRGARWSSPGRPVVYASECVAGAILEILAHSARPRTLPGAHHGVCVAVPDGLVERLSPDDVPGWERPGSGIARRAGDRWLSEARSLALLVPSLPARPAGRNVLLNPEHPEIDRLEVVERFEVPWDERLFQ